MHIASPPFCELFRRTSMKNNSFLFAIVLTLLLPIIRSGGNALADGTEASFLQAFRSLHSTDIAGMGEDWFQGVLPFDLDGDGDEDCIAYDTNGDDCSWLFHERTDNGWNLSRPNARGKHDIDRIARLDARQYSFSSFQPRTIRLGCSASSTTGRDTLPPTIQRSARTLLLSSSSPVAFMKSGCGQTACRLSSMLRRSSVFSAFCPRNTAGRISLYRKRVGPPADTPTFLRRV